MSFGYLHARLARLKAANQVLVALDVIRTLRRDFLEGLDWRDVAHEGAIEVALDLFKRGLRPFEQPPFLDQLKWENLRYLLTEFLKALAATGLRDGGLHGLIRDLETDERAIEHMVRASLEPSLEHLSYLAAKYGIEAELLRYLLTTPLVPLFAKLREVLPLGPNPLEVRRCLLCGSSFTLGVYRAGYRHLLCPVCGFRVHVDFFWCPSCGNTNPETMGFVKLSEEPALQVEYCRKCNTYYKFIDEDAAGLVVEDPALLDLATVDLDPLAKEALEARRG